MFSHKKGSSRLVTRAAFAAAAVVALLIVPACGKVSQLQALKSLKAANQNYKAGDYKAAASLYQQAVDADPNQAVAYFYLANSYDQLYKPSKKGEKDNDELLEKAAQNYQTAADKLSASPKPEDKKLGKDSLAFLVALYGPDKLNDPAKAEPVVQHMIQLEPSDPANYFALAKIYEDAGAYDPAEQMLLKAKEVAPNNPDVYAQLAGYYNRQAEFQKTIDALQEGASKQPNNPEAFYKVATYYWDEAYRDARLKLEQKKDFAEKGLVAINRALEIKPDYIDGIVYKGLLLRVQAQMEKDPKKQAALIDEAKQLQQKAEELKKKKATG
jgi:tetratricopeptide (TPR) repeat protein